MSVILHENRYYIVFINSWDVSGAMGNVWHEDSKFTISHLTAGDLNSHLKSGFKIAFSPPQRPSPSALIRPTLGLEPTASAKENQRFNT